MSTGTTNRWRIRAQAQVPWLILVIILIALLVVQVQAALNPDFTGKPRSGVTPLTVQFNDTSTGFLEPVTYLWNFGDGNKSSVQNPLYIYNHQGSFTVTLAISNASGEQATIAQNNYITVEQPLIPVPLIPNFTGAPRSGVSPLTVQFNDTSTGPHDQWQWEFGDGNKSAEQKPLYTYNQDGSYNVKLIISNASGEKATITQNNYITVEQPLVPDFNATPRSGVSPLNVQFNDTSTGPHDQWQWEFGDGNKSIEQKPLYTYNLPGKYNVKLIISNASGEQATLVQDNYITVDPAPIAGELVLDFTGTPRSGVSPLTVQFNDASSGFVEPVTYLWDFGDGGTSTERNPLYTYTQQGSHTVTLNISQASGAAASIAKNNYITVTLIPLILLNTDFTGTPRSGVTPLTVQFNDTSTGPHDQWEWEFGDGNKSVEQKPLYTYHKPGSYTVKLIISNASGEQATIAQDNYINVNPAPTTNELILDFNGTPRSGVSPLTIQFNDLSTGFLEPVAYLWDFGDGGISTEQNPLYTYNQKGSYTVTLNVSQSIGAPASIAKNKYITVTSIPLILPVVDFFGIPTSGIAPLTVIFTDLSTNTPLAWNWSFGDDSIENATEQNPIHTYADPGTYTVSVNATNANGSDSRTREGYIKVRPAAVPHVLPTADFFGIPTSGVAPLTVSFTDLSTNTPASWNWSFGDDSLENATVQNPVHTYANPGTFTVLLNASNADGSDIKIRSEYITVSSVPLTPLIPEPLIPDFSGTPLSGPAPLTVKFNDASTGLHDQWVWDFGDGNKSSTQNPLYTYNIPGSFNVTLNISQAGGEPATITQHDYITVVTPLIPVPLNQEPLIPNFTGTPTSGPAPLTVQFNDISTGLHDQWKWEFGDGNTSSKPNPLNIYDKPGSYSVILNVSQAGGDSVSTTQHNYITVSSVPLAPPVADFSGKPTSGVAPLTVAFTDLSKNTPTSWNWSFGDDSPENATIQNPVHTYTRNGNFTVSLNATNADGSDNKILNDYITVSAVPLTPLVTDFSGAPTSGVTPLTVTFKDLSTNTPISRNWSFGDNSTENASEQNPVHTYTRTGNFTVSLNATNAAGLNITTKTNYINVTAVPAAPVADFSGTPTHGVAPLTVQFNDTSTGFVSPITYFWDFGDGSNSTERNPSHTYTTYTSENYTVTLKVTGNYGQTDYLIRTGYITNEIPTIELRISTELIPDQSLNFNGSIQTIQSLSHVQSLPHSKSALRAQSLPQGLPGYQDQSLPQDISTQNDLSADFNGTWWVVPGEVSWSLNPGENVQNNAFWMILLSSGNWEVLVSDDCLNGKPPGTEGRLAEYDYSPSPPPHYVSPGEGGEALNNPLRVQNETGYTVTLSGTKQRIQTGPPISFPFWYAINLKQKVESSDKSLGTNRGYRIEITFEASNIGP